MIQKHWDDFIKAFTAKLAASDSSAGPNDAQTALMKSCFFAGATAMQHIQFLIGNQDISEEDSIAILVSVDEELKAFYANSSPYQYKPKLDS